MQTISFPTWKDVWGKITNNKNRCSKLSVRKEVIEKNFQKHTGFYSEMDHFASLQKY
jgi:hypothetical protein